MEKSILFKTKLEKEQTLIIPNNVFKKIQQWCRVSPTTEWSGYLFYHYEGNFEDGLKLTVKDFLVSNIGTATFTEFKVDAEITQYMVLSDLIDCKIGLIHSHQQMATFFSGTDESTLEKEGEESCNFLSLIVNNEESYTARITRQITTTIEGEATSVSKCFGTETNKKKESINYSKVTGVEWFPLSIKIIGKEPYIEEDILNRYKELKEKNITIKEPHTFSSPTLFDDDDMGFYTPVNTFKTNTVYTHKSQESLQEAGKVEIVKVNDIDSYAKKAKVDKQKVYDMAIKLITASPSSKLALLCDIKKYAENDMVKDMKNAFSDIVTYEDYITELCDFLLSHIVDEGLETYLSLQDPTVETSADVMCIYAYHVANVLNSVKPNIYINVIIEALNSYIFSNEF